MKRKLILLIPLFIFLVIISFGIGVLIKEDKNILTKIDAREEVFMPAFSLPELNNPNGTFSNEDLKGQYSLINVFASWCFNCAAENDFLMKISSGEIGGGKIKIYGVAWRDINKNTTKYLTKHGNPYVKIGVDGKGVFSKLLAVNGTPESFLIDPEGRIITYFKGAIDEDFFR
ncbi:MAG: cytochrome c biogenesis protein CcmG/thiol:disulfide interchange protein DsbE [Rickettsiales bacterium]|jgi:cytochrome c biogenesis protein CcmG/thiol:disulfide interchange protein DsbE